MDEAIASLEKRLKNDPDDVNGWKMLGRTHQAMGNFDGAAAAFERAVELENGQVAQTLIDLAIAITNRDQAPLQEGRAMDLIDSALKLDPNSQPALFYSGVAAANRGDTEAAATLWERLLELNPPAGIVASIRLVAGSAVSLPLGLFIGSSSLTASLASSQSSGKETLTNSCGWRSASSSGSTRGTIPGLILSILKTEITSS